MTDETDAPWQLVIDQMIRAERIMPDDFWAVAAAQDLAHLCADLRDRLSDEEYARLIAVGAMLARLGKDEAKAGIRAALAIKGIKPVRRGSKEP